MESKENVRRGAKDLQLFERKRIEQMHNAGHSAEEIAVEIGVCYVTIYRELKRGDTGEMDELGRRVYDAELAQRKAALARRNKGSKNPENDGRCRRRGQNTGGETHQDSGQQV